MATYYVSSAAGGSGTGTSGSPWTLAQATAYASYADGDVVDLGSGAYTSSVGLSWAKDKVIVWQGTGSITWSGGSPNLSTDHGTRLYGLTLVGSGANANLVNGGGVVSGCTLSITTSSNPGSVLAGGTYLVTRSSLSHASGSGNVCYISTSSISECLVKRGVLTAASGGILAVRNCVIASGASVSALSGGGIDLDGTIFCGSGTALTVAGGSYWPGAASGLLFTGAGTASISNGRADVAFDGLSNATAVFASGGTTPYTSSFTQFAFDPFAAASTYDLRLTATAKASAIAPSLRRAVARVLNVPGLTTDGLQGLFASGVIVIDD